MRRHECNPHCQGNRHGVTGDELESVVEKIGDSLNEAKVLGRHPAVAAALIVIGVRVCMRGSGAPRAEIERMFKEILDVECEDALEGVDASRVAVNRSTRMH